MRRGTHATAGGVYYVKTLIRQYYIVHKHTQMMGWWPAAVAVTELNQGENSRHTDWRLQQLEEIFVPVCLHLFVCVCVGCVASIQHHHGVPLLFNVISSVLRSD